MVHCQEIRTLSCKQFFLFLFDAVIDAQEGLELAC